MFFITKCYLTNIEIMFQGKVEVRKKGLGIMEKDMKSFIYIYLNPLIVNKLKISLINTRTSFN